MNRRKHFLNIYFITILVYATLHGASQAQSGIAQGLCETGANVLNAQTIPFRRQGIPIDYAEQAFDTFIDQPRFWRFMRRAVQQTYADPDGMTRSLRDGSWMGACIRAVQGF